MDTLPLNGNHANNYTMASSEYLSDCVQILDRSGGYGTHSNHKETTLEKKILKELTSNYIPSYLNNHERATTERNHNLMNKLVNSSMANGGDCFDSPQTCWCTLTCLLLQLSYQQSRLVSVSSLTNYIWAGYFGCPRVNSPCGDQANWLKCIGSAFSFTCIPM